MYYVYRITNILENKHYYGQRCQKTSPENDLGILYYSSSTDKSFISDQKQNPFNYRYKIVRVFDDKEQALRFEIKLHNKFDVDLNPNFYNKAKQTSPKFSYDSSGSKHTIETKIKIGIKTKERSSYARSEEHNIRNSNNVKKQWFGDEARKEATRKRMKEYWTDENKAILSKRIKENPPTRNPIQAAKQSASLTGYKHTDEAKNNMSKSRTGLKRGKYKQNSSKGKSKYFNIETKSIDLIHELDVNSTIHIKYNKKIHRSYAEFLSQYNV